MAGTVTLPVDRRPPVAVLDPVIALGEVGTGREWPLALDQGWFVVGRAGCCDVAIDRPWVSSPHCLIERRDGQIVVVDRSKNGTFIRGIRVPRFEIVAGTLFYVADTPLIALSAPMRAAKPTLALLLGDDPAAIDRALAAGATAPAILIVGPRGSGHRELSASLHGVSPRRKRSLDEVSAIPARSGRELPRGPVFDGLSPSHRPGPPVENLPCPPPPRASIDASVGPDTGTLVVDRSRLATLPPEGRRTAQQRLAALIEGGHAGVHVIASTTDAAAHALGPLVHKLALVEIPPLSTRRDELAMLLDKLLTELGYSCRAADLGADNLAALEAHRWRRNLDGLRTAARLLGAILTAGGINRRAIALLEDAGVERSSWALRKWARTMGLDFAHKRRGRAKQPEKG